MRSLREVTDGRKCGGRVFGHPRQKSVDGCRGQLFGLADAIRCSGDRCWGGSITTKTVNQHAKVLGADQGSVPMPIDAKGPYFFREVQALLVGHVDKVSKGSVG
jgi:hypothetical protein